MSIGKNSIARAVSSTNTAAKAQNKPTDNLSVSKLPIINIGLLSIAKVSDDIDTLQSSIQKRGLLCPVIVAATAKGDFWLIDGYRRLSAAKKLGNEQITATVINVENKRDANNLYSELQKTKPAQAEPIVDNIHEEKFRVLCVKDHDLPTYLL